LHQDGICSMLAGWVRIDQLVSASQSRFIVEAASSISRVRRIFNNV
jgi:hypothetical protein